LLIGLVDLDLDIVGSRQVGRSLGRYRLIPEFSTGAAMIVLLETASHGLMMQGGMFKRCCRGIRQ